MNLLSKNIYLIGPMGVGKTSIGRNLARQLAKEFIDSDLEIERRTGVDISTIFSIEGEEGFRIRERDMLHELALKTDIVMATGGGSILRQDNRQILRKTGIVIYLLATIDVLLERTSRSKKRPLLQTDDRRARLEQLFLQRDPIYRAEADLIIETQNRSPQKVARDSIQQLQNL